MSGIIKKLDQIEARLQTLIEGRIAGLLPEQFDKAHLIDALIEALQAGVIDQQGVLTAPDQFHIRTHPQHLLQQISPESITYELGEILHQAADQAGLVFHHSPVIDLLPLPSLGADEIDILTAFGADAQGETYALHIESESDIDSIPPNAFLIVDGSHIFTLDQSVVNIGRRNGNDLVIDDPRVSRSHAQLRATRGRYILFDLDSTGGTMVNGKTISHSPLFPRDVISLAGVPLVYAQDDAIAADSTQEYQTKPSDDDEHPTRGAML